MQAVYNYRSALLPQEVRRKQPQASQAQLPYGVLNGAREVQVLLAVARGFCAGQAWLACLHSLGTFLLPEPCHFISLAVPQFESGV